jgi:hypothetical protein
MHHAATAKTVSDRKVRSGVAESRQTKVSNTDYKVQQIIVVLGTPNVRVLRTRRQVKRQPSFFSRPQNLFLGKRALLQFLTLTTSQPHKRSVYSVEYKSVGKGLIKF